jgi:hypothetical protein
MSLFCGHAETPWMPRLRTAAARCRWLSLGLVAGAAIDLIVRAVVG